MSIDDDEASRLLGKVVEKHADELIEFRRDLHAHPELSWTRGADHRRGRLAARAGRTRASAAWPRSGLIAEIGATGPLVALRADLDALPVDDRTEDPWRSTVRQRRPRLRARRARRRPDRRRDRPRRGRRRRPPARPGPAAVPARRGGHARWRARPDQPGALDGRQPGLRAALRPQPSTSALVGLREGPLTGAADALEVHLRGKGGHTSRPHLTEDLTFALGKVVTELPAILSRRLDPRAGRQRGVGRGPGRLGAQRHPGHRPPRRHGPHARRGRLGRRGAPGPPADRADHRSPTA